MNDSYHEDAIRCLFKTIDTAIGANDDFSVLQGGKFREFAAGFRERAQPVD
jgi:hypothetical protein